MSNTGIRGVSGGNFEFGWRLHVALGTVPDHSLMSAIGEIENMTTDPTDVWRGNELTPAPASITTVPTPSAAGEQMTIVSESANDASAGTGIQTVQIHYLDASGDQQKEDITMTGTTPAHTVATDIMFVNEMHALTVGTGTVAAGHIKLYKFGDASLVYSMIAAAGNFALMPHRMVPSGHKLVITSFHATEGNSKRAAFRLRATNDGLQLLSGVFLFKDSMYLSKSALTHDDLLVPVPSLSIVKVTAWPSAVGSEGSCHWQGILIKD